MATALRASASLLVRPALPDDLAGLAALKRRVERRCYGHLASEDALAVRLHRRSTAWWLLGRLSAGDLVLLAQHEGTVLGLGAARFDGSVVHLHSSYVEHEGYGAGRALASARLEAAETRGIAKVTADAFVGCAPAELWLRRLGMEPLGPITESASFPGVGLTHWVGDVTEARRRLSRERTPA